MNAKRTIRQSGFTLAEILTTIAIIAILLAVLLPTLNQVGKTAANVKQKAQFHSIEIALETFRSDIGDYPPSAYDSRNEYKGYTAPQRLAEALIGRDGFGFHPSSVFRNDGKDASGQALYYPDFVPADDAARKNNLAVRKGPYLELETANAVLLSNIVKRMSSTLVNSYVFADAFKTTKNKQTGKKTGLPILYYRADRTKMGHPLSAPFNLDNCTYDVRDANEFLALLADDYGQMAAKWFYERTWNRNFQNPPRPYRAESFILQSAGPDGFYGTMDDVFNFDQDQ